MQCIILAAGEGTRMRPLTLDRPKPLIEVFGKPLAQYVLDALPPEIDEIIFIIGYKGEQIQERFGDAYRGMRIRYIHQAERSGTASAIALAQPFITGKFLVMPADDLHGAEALAKAAQHDLCLLVAPSDHPERFGVVSLKSDGTLSHIVEKPAHPPTNLVSTGAMVLDRRIFDYAAPLSESGEYYLPDMLTQLAAHAVVAVQLQDQWFPLGYPDDIEKAEALLAARATAPAR